MSEPVVLAVLSVGVGESVEQCEKKIRARVGPSLCVTWRSRKWRDKYAMQRLQLSYAPDPRDLTNILIGRKQITKRTRQWNTRRKLRRSVRSHRMWSSQEKSPRTREFHRWASIGQRRDREREGERRTQNDTAHRGLRQAPE